MPMFETEEEFEAYLAHQQAEVDADRRGQAAGPATQPSKPASNFSAAGVATIAVPVLLTIAGVVFVLNNKHDQRRSDDFWDNALSTTAWATGREYNANAKTLTERFTLRKKGDKGGEK